MAEDRSALIEQALGAAHHTEPSLDRLFELIGDKGDYAARESLDFARRATAIALRLNYRKGITRGIYLQARFHELLSEYDVSIKSYEKALELSGLSDDSHRLEILMGLGSNYYQMGEFELSLRFSLEALELQEKQGELKKRGTALMHIGSVYQRLNDFDSALDYYRRALESMRDGGSKTQEASLLGNMGGLYAQQGRVKEALDYFDQSLKIREEMGDKRNKGTLMNNIGQCYVLMKDFEKAKTYFFESIRLHNEFSNRVGESSALINMGELALTEQKPEIGIDCLKRALVIADELKLKFHSYHIHEVISRAYATVGDYKMAMEHHKEFHRVKEEVHNQEANRKIDNMRHLHQLENAKKESEIERLRNVELKKAYAEIEVKTKEIQDSINYALLIQQAMYPLPEELRKIFPFSFGMVKPKNVVNGDFVWATSRNGLSYIAAADCTGHGIPGAFMSMIGIEKLNQAVYGSGLKRPSQILEAVNRGIKFSLKQNSEESLLRDGMDMSLCAFDFDNNKLFFASANRPIYHVREGALTEILPTKSAIGGLTSNDQEFPDQVIELKKGDLIYMFTDGFADQFGGEQGKKFTTRRFKELLLSNCNDELKTQREKMVNTLKDWMTHKDPEEKPFEQTDDITVIGISI